MFTGLIEDVGSLQILENQGEERLVHIRCGLDLQGVALGDSIAVNGVCLTVTAKGADFFAAQLSAETVQRTTFAHLRRGATVNLERALAYGGRLNGHLVQGHVDAVGRVERLLPRGNSLEVCFCLPRSAGRYLVHKGSVAVDGVSLTVNTVTESAEITRFTVNIIPHTQKKTTLALLAVNREVNIETDLLGRYVERLLAPSAKSSPLDAAYLRERGF
ncbi:MAG: riboflavin synthase [Magnetococcales bacterium]|nr:riboflavin synthase [Magnetococcales bacterium]